MTQAVFLTEHDELLTLPKAAKLYPVTPASLQVWALERRLPYVLAGRLMLFRRADVLAHKAERQRDAARSVHALRAASEERSASWRSEESWQSVSEGLDTPALHPSHCFSLLPPRDSEPSRQS
jgi:hypothetical protein